MPEFICILLSLYVYFHCGNCFAYTDNNDIFFSVLTLQNIWGKSLTGLLVTYYNRKLTSTLNIFSPLVLLYILIEAQPSLILIFKGQN